MSVNSAERAGAAVSGVKHTATVVIPLKNVFKCLNRKD